MLQFLKNKLNMYFGKFKKYFFPTDNSTKVKPEEKRVVK